MLDEQQIMTTTTLSRKASLLHHHSMNDVMSPTIIIDVLTNMILPYRKVMMDIETIQLLDQRV